MTLKDMRESFSTGVDNTGNVCLWPAEEVMAHYILTRASDFAGKNICELGAGVGLCGLAMARVLKANSLLLTDGNAQVVDTLEKALQVRRSEICGRVRFARRRCAAPGVRWRQRLTPFPMRPSCVQHNRTLDGLATLDVSTRLLVWDRKLTSLEVPRAGTFDFVVAADCLFFKDYHVDLVHTIKTLLSARCGSPLQRAKSARKSEERAPSPCSGGCGVPLCRARPAASTQTAPNPSQGLAVCCRFRCLCKALLRLCQARAILGLIEPWDLIKVA